MQNARPGVARPADAGTLAGLLATTGARIGVGRAGPRYRTATLLRFQADHAVTRDTLGQDVDRTLIEDLGLFIVQTAVTGGATQYLLRPDLGRRIDDAGRRMIRGRCVPRPDIQIAVGDGLSAAAVEANVPALLPALTERARDAGLSTGTPFFVRHARVGVLNDIGDLLGPQVAVLLIGERPGLGRAESLSAYLAYAPAAGQTDANHDVISSVFPDGGTHPLVAAGLIIDLARAMITHRASGVRLKLALGRA